MALPFNRGERGSNFNVQTMRRRRKAEVHAATDQYRDQKALTLLSEVHSDFLTDVMVPQGEGVNLSLDSHVCNACDVLKKVPIE